MNMREYTKMQNETVSRLSFDIGDPYRQIVQYDYALEELELLEKLHQLENNLWSEEEDALMREYYGKHGSGINYLLTVLPNRTRISIISRAKILGLAGTRKEYSEEFKDDIKNIIVRKMESTSSFRNIPDTPAQVSPILLTGWDLPFGTASHGQQKKTSS